MFNYWSSLLSHWAEKEFISLGYQTPPEHEPIDVHILRELATKCPGLFHWNGTQYNLLVPNNGELYKFLKDHSPRIENCVFQTKAPNTMKEELFKVVKHDKVLITADYIAYENVTVTALDNFDGCSVVSKNHEALASFSSKSIDLFERILKLFKC